MDIGTTIIGIGAIAVTADIAEWCFRRVQNAEPKLRAELIRQEHTSRRNHVASERQKQRQIKRETQQALQDEEYDRRGIHLDMLSEYMDKVWQMRYEAKNLRRQFLEIIRSNRNIMKSSSLTFQQQDAIHESIRSLEEGAARLDAYSGPYLQGFIDAVSNAKQAVLEMEDWDEDALIPEAGLPEDFPYAGKILCFSSEEIRSLIRCGGIEIGVGETGVLSLDTEYFDSANNTIALVERYDRDRDVWVLSFAKGYIAASYNNQIEPHPFEVMLLTRNKGGFRAVWHMSGGESVETFLPYALMNVPPFLTPLGIYISVYIHQIDYLLRRIVVGQNPPVSKDDFGDRLLLKVAASSLRREIEQELYVSPQTFWIRESGNCYDSQLIMRLGNGSEFSVVATPTEQYLKVREKIGARIGIVDGVICSSRIDLSFSDSSSQGKTVTASDFVKRIHERLDEQDELHNAFEEEILETKKYQLILEAAIEASKAEPLFDIPYDSYNVSECEEFNSVSFAVEISRIPSNLPFELSILFRGRPSSKKSRELCGYLREINRQKSTIVCSFDKHDIPLFQNKKFPQTGTVLCVAVHADLQRQANALEQFRNANFLQNRNHEQRECFRNLRRVLLGLPVSKSQENRENDVQPKLGCKLNERQREAFRLINSEEPLALILGPPGTGKTDTIAVALEAYLHKHRNAHVAVVSQANVAVDEVLCKLKEHYPTCDIHRIVSRHAQESMMESNKDMTQHAHCEEFLQRLGQKIETLPGWGKDLRRRFQHLCIENQEYLEKRVMRTLTNSASVLGCTLGILDRHFGDVFDLVIIDEAAKASLPDCMRATLISKRLVLVGDHHQLLPYLDERMLEGVSTGRKVQAEIQELWNNSLFRRMWLNAPPHVKVELNTQYRSRSGIQFAVSKLFYEGKLQSGRTDGSEKVPWPFSLVWLDTKTQRYDQEYRNCSLINQREANIVSNTLKMLARTLPHSQKTSVAIISIYGEQRNLIESMIQKSNLKSRFRELVVKTVDSSQGGQWDVVLLNLGRASGDTKFTGNPNRLNVALSRAKELVVVIGSLAFGLRDRCPESMLGKLAKHIRWSHDHAIRKIFICEAATDGSVPDIFGFKKKFAQKTTVRQGKEGNE